MISAQNLEPVRSEFADDEDFVELLEMFTDEIPIRRQRLEVAYNAQDIAELKSLAHQLKGAGGGYGYPHLTIISARLEQACKDSVQDEITSQYQELHQYLGRVTA
ncbi:Hpt domain protein [Polystyrenella longa]|uniref:Hpt domain protein n=1 Tax=Polystyrenella longa TaxID=2528007 RepID=A0A518CRQ7_9PLAN|nr:Hpt domain-containing protein [Polystyrenella longa]QDU81911.1 Hpt domain protein [Polystyrenella longa]